MYQILALIAFIIFVIIFSLKKWKRNREKDMLLSEKFDDIYNWDTGDKIQYSTKWGDVSSGRIFIFKPNGIYVLSDHWWAESINHPEASLSHAIFVPTVSIKQNLTIPSRTIREDLLESLDDEFSYHNQMQVIQGEMKELNRKYKVNS